MTYSIVARDPATGEMGVAVQSRYFAAGSVVPWPEAGVGAVATQAFAEQCYGPLGLELMRSGHSAPEALRALLAGDGGEALRQVATLDATGEVAAHTGSRCVAAAGHWGGSKRAARSSNAHRWPSHGGRTSSGGSPRRDSSRTIRPSWTPCCPWSPSDPNGLTTTLLDGPAPSHACYGHAEPEGPTPA